MLARVLLNGLIPSIAQENTPESQCGFRSYRETVDIIFVRRKIQEKCREHNIGPYAAFVDLTRFDTVSRNGLWKILARLGCPPKFLAVLHKLHEGQQGQVKHNGSLSGSFPISNGVTQGCILAPHCSQSSSASCCVRQKRICQMANTFVFEQLTVTTFGVSSQAQKPSRNPSLSCCLLTTAPFSPTRKKPYSTSSTASPMLPRTSASPSA